NLSNNLSCGSGGSNGSTFSGLLAGLSPGTTYYYRAYATNSAGTGYGITKSFTTSNVAPTVTTDDASSITSIGATLNATINANGGAAITARGFQWGTSSGNLSNNLSCGSGGGSGSTFSGSLTGLNPSTTYYYRAYATNSVGTSYGITKSFTTVAGNATPTVTTDNTSNVTNTGATLHATINGTGGATITARGFHWGTSSGSLSNTLSCGSGGSANSTYSGSLTGLSPGTTYYYRAYATNSVGTGYGTTKSFTTAPSTPPRIEIIQVPNTVPIKIGTPNNNNQTVDEFLINGSRILNTDSTLPGSLTVKGHPIAVHSQMNPKEIQYYYNVSNAASVKCKYDISTVSGAHSWTNDYAPNTAISGTIKVPFPLFNAVGKYYLAVHFEYYNSGGSFLTSQTIEHPLYLLYGSLDNNEIVPNYNYTPYPNNYVMADTKIPRTAWLDMAMEFLRLGPKRLALEGIDDWIVRSLMNGIYRNDGVTHPIWQYGLHQDQTGPAAPVYRYPAPWLIENRKPSLSAYTGLALRTDCEQIRDVLRILGNSLGVSVGSQRFSPDYAGLMTKPGYPAFDNAGMNGYRRINGEIEDNPSVWFFLDHFYTEYGQNAYDPVFNIKDVALNMYQEHILALKEPSKWYRLEDGTILYSLLPKEILDSSNNYVFNNRGWVKISYDYPFSPANMLPLSLTPLETAKLETAARNAAKNNPSANDQLRKATLRVPPGASVNCVGYDLTDTDNNGLAEWLSLDIEVYSGLYDLEGFLEAEIYGSNGSLITSSRMSTQNLSFDDNLISLSSFTSEYLTLYFNGKHIKDSEIDGPYEIHVHLTNEGENIFLEDWLSTDPLLADDFQGNLLEVTAISDSLINLGETLRFTASIQAQVAGDYDLSASLFKINGAEQTGLGNLALNLNLAAGINQVNFDFDAKELRGKGISGPYDLFLSSSDEFYANYDHHQSAGYLLSQLASPSAYIDGELSEIIIQPSSKIMTAANELFISAPVVVSNAGIYHMQAILWDQEGNLLSATLWQDTLSAGPQPVEFNFDLSGLPVVESPCVVEFRICDDYAQYGFSAILEVEI
ncbi:MAG: hypothetical protein LBB91_05240, partial [Clostridiales bacterium]|nr:hypothetical protein [Clostridiales bacterium]